LPKKLAYLFSGSNWESEIDLEPVLELRSRDWSYWTALGWWALFSSKV